MRYFYAIFVQEPHISSMLSMLRYVCDPHQKYAAHVTLRGPYAQPLPRNQREELSAKVEGSKVDVWEAGAFIGAGQNTVFLHCDSPYLRRVWHKPKLRYTPHLTLYDGPSREFAMGLQSLLREYDTRFQFTATGLFELKSSRGQHTFELRVAVKESELLALLSESFVRMDEMRRVPDAARLLVVRNLCDRLFVRNSRSSPAPRQIAPPMLSTLAGA